MKKLQKSAAICALTTSCGAENNAEATPYGNTMWMKDWSLLTLLQVTEHKMCLT